MRRAMTSLLTMGIGAIAYSMTNRRNRRRFQHMIQPLATNMGDMIPTRKLRKMSKRLVKAIS